MRKIFSKYTFQLNTAALLFLLLFVTGFMNNTVAQNDRTVTELTKGWLFINKDVPAGAGNQINENLWKKVTLPHDWAISGPFNKAIDIQTVQVTEDGEVKASERTGRTGGLPYIGVGWYRLHLKFSTTEKEKNFYLEFDGAMSHAKVYVNNQLAGEWPYGYSSFRFNITRFIQFGQDNIIAVRLENYPESARWYPGAGLYRKVKLIKTNPVHIAPLGTYITTPVINADKALVAVETTIEANEKKANNLELTTTLYDDQNRVVAQNTITPDHHKVNKQHLSVPNPRLWSAEKPVLYYAISTLKNKNRIVDQYKTVFGIRSIRFLPEKGMLVNGDIVKIKGVCMHDDLGALGMAFNKAVLRYRLQLLKEMGCNAIRGAHNPHAPEMLELCDEMGFYFMDEAFDEWKSPKVKNGYHQLFDQWAAKDIEALIKRDRNHPSVIMYSIGNEVKEQNEKGGDVVARYLTELCHQFDSTRPVTAGFNNMNAAIKNGLANAVDIPGWNYKPEFYASLHKQYPDWVIYGSETVSTVSSRGAFKLPADTAIMKVWSDHQSSAYDLEYCRWSQLPDMEWKSQANEYVAGEFVWTGFDYLGEPTPYNANWPSRSSYFGIIDLAGIPKDRYFLYQSKWAQKKVLHLLPHWNWKGMEGKPVPVYVYTNYPAAEVFINGKSLGKKTFNENSLLDSYRLRWENTLYEPGELKVVAYDNTGNVAETKSMHTAGAPAQLVLKTNRSTLSANGEDMALITVSVTDKDGNLCPLAEDLIHFEISGAGRLRAVDNGDPTSMASFEIPERKAFFGKCLVYIQTNEVGGSIKITAKGKNLKSSTIELNAIKTK